MEPDEHSAAWLSNLYKRDSRVEVVQKAVGREKGETEMYIHSEGSAFNTLSRKWKETIEDQEQTRFENVKSFQKGYTVEVTTLDCLIEEYGHPDYIKLDVEGYEASALSGLSRVVNIIQFEANLPEFREETIKCIDILNDLTSSVQFSYATSEGLTGNFDRWSDYQSFRGFVRDTDIRFMGIVARLEGK